MKLNVRKVRKGLTECFSLTAEHRVTITRFHRLVHHGTFLNNSFSDAFDPFRNPRNNHFFRVTLIGRTGARNRCL